ncbi:MAG: type I-C CRISPR-associated protein Cas5 [Deltaproteobacteria bacterium]|nr:type I-C CRISPR-associated protein Cas5 [Deltaproteobacteria bacterium]
MAYGIRLKVWGEYACFTRPEVKNKRVSYAVLPPSAARGILEAIYWTPTLCWVVHRIYVMNPIQFEEIMRYERIREPKPKRPTPNSCDNFTQVTHKMRPAKVLRNVVYGIEAHFKLRGASDGNATKHKKIFERRARKGRCFQQPFLGCRNYPAEFELIENEMPESALNGTYDMGRLLQDADHKNCIETDYFRAIMQDGIIEVPPKKGAM